MYAVLTTVDVEPGHEREGIEHLEKNVIPGIRQAPGIVGAYWLAPVDNQGLVIFLVENEGAAEGLAQAMPNAPMADFAKLASVQVIEVLAHL